MGLPVGSRCEGRRAVVVTDEYIGDKGGLSMISAPSRLLPCPRAGHYLQRAQHMWSGTTGMPGPPPLHARFLSAP